MPQPAQGSACVSCKHGQQSAGARHGQRRNQKPAAVPPQGLGRMGKCCFPNAQETAELQNKDFRGNIGVTGSCIFSFFKPCYEIWPIY